MKFQYKRYLDLRYEIERLQCVLFKGMVSQKMFHELTIKLVILEKELEPGYFILPSEESYKYIPMEKRHYKKLRKLYKKFKLIRCEECDAIMPIDEECSNGECSTNKINLSDLDD